MVPVTGSQFLLLCLRTYSLPGAWSRGRWAGEWEYGRGGHNPNCSRKKLDKGKGWEGTE